jgi:hypothetical protein
VSVEYLINQCGQTGTLVLHHSLDGREFAGTAKRGDPGE